MYPAKRNAPLETADVANHPQQVDALPEKEDILCIFLFRRQRRLVNTVLEGLYAKS